MMRVRSAVPAAQPRPSALRSLAPALGFLGLLFVTLVCASVFSDRVPGHFIVYFPSSVAPAEAFGRIGAAGGQIVAVGGWANSYYIATDEADFTHRADRLGAWIVIGAPRYLGCGTLEERAV